MKTSRFSNNLNNTSLHTSGFAEVANGNAMGASSSQSFAERRQLERRRRHIGGYRQSMVGRAYGERRAVKAPERTAVIASPQNARQAQNAQAPAAPSRPSFREPPSRGFNPFG